MSSTTIPSSTTSTDLSKNPDLATPATELPIADQIVQAIVELQEYRDRLIAETTETAKRAKLMKSVMMEQLEPELAKIDAGLQYLRDQQASL